MSKGMFDDLTELMGTNLNTKQTMTNEVKDLEDHHREIAEKMAENFDENKGYVEKQLQYPFIEIVGPKTSFEIEHVKRTGTTEESLPLMVQIQGVFAGLGSLDLTYHNIIDLMSIAEYKLILHETPEEREEVSEKLLLTLLLT